MVNIHDLKHKPNTQDTFLMSFNEASVLARWQDYSWLVVVIWYEPDFSVRHRRSIGGENFEEIISNAFPALLTTLTRRGK